jgi:hypothetical protein
MPIRHWPGAEGALTGLTNEKCTLPLLRELGFGVLPTSAGPELAGRTYAINRFLGPVLLHLVGCGLSLDRRAAGVRGAAAAGTEKEENRIRSEGTQSILRQGFQMEGFIVSTR